MDNDDYGAFVRRVGYFWAEIASRLGITWQATQQRWVCIFPSVATAEATVRNRKHGWPNWLGGLTLLLVVNVPTYVLLSRAAGNIPYRTGLFLAAFLVLLHLALQALIAPLVSYRRRDAFTIFIPFVGWVITWILGARLAELSKRDWAQPDQRHNRRWKTASHPR